MFPMKYQLQLKALLLPKILLTATVLAVTPRVNEKLIIDAPTPVAIKASAIA